ncbi:MAG TPA: hypothetical protein VIG33_05095 [Pseudobdellovibrionaceae bacterium]
MNKLSILLVVGSVLTFSGVFALLTKPLPAPSSMTRQEVPPRPFHRGVASAGEGFSAQPAIESVRSQKQ